MSQAIDRHVSYEKSYSYEDRERLLCEHGATLTTLVVKQKND